MPDVLAFAEQKDGRFKRSALGAVSEASRQARGLGGAGVAVLIGPAPAAMEPVFEAGAARAVVIEGLDPAHYSPEAQALAIAELARARKPGAIFLPASTRGKDLAPRIAALLDVPMISDCTQLKQEGGRLRARGTVFAGQAFGEVSGDPPLVVTLRPNVFPLEKAPAAPQVEKFPAPKPPEKRAVLKETIAAEGGKLELTEASVIVSGGRGLKGPEHFHLIEELAKAFGGAVGASRAVVDAGWRPHSEQVGQTGKTVTPNLYVAVGISGAIQHLAGMSSSKCIVAINKDPEAPIFKVADYGIVGDAFEVIPALIDALNKRKG